MENNKKNNSCFLIKILKYLFPCKGDSKSKVSGKILFLLSIVIFVVSLVSLKSLLDDEKKAKDYDSALSELKSDSDFNSVSESDNSFSDDAVEKTVCNWAEKSLEINSDVVGWIEIPGFTDYNGNEYIDFPVLQRYTGNFDEDNNFYLTRNIYKQYYESGSIFADSMIPIDENSQPDNIVIYGHHMRKLGTSFTHLAEYKSGVQMVRDNPLIEFKTIYENDGEYVIIGCFVAAESIEQDDEQNFFDYWRFRNFDKEDHSFEKWITNVRKQSWYSCDVECTEDDDYITLSTCSNEVLNMRWVIVAKKLTSNDNIGKIKSSYEERNDSEIYFPRIWREQIGNHKKYNGWDY